MPDDYRRRAAEVDRRHLTCDHQRYARAIGAGTDFSMRYCAYCNAYQITRCDEKPEAVTGEWLWDLTCSLLGREVSA